MNEQKHRAMIAALQIGLTQRQTAIYVAAAIEHALTCPTFRVEYGSYGVECLQSFIDNIAGNIAV